MWALEFLVEELFKNCPGKYCHHINFRVICLVLKDAGGRSHTLRLKGLRATFMGRHIDLLMVDVSLTTTRTTYSYPLLDILKKGHELSVFTNTA